MNRLWCLALVVAAPLAGCGAPGDDEKMAEELNVNSRYIIETVRVSGNTLAIAYELGQEELLQTAEGTFSTSGNVFTETFTCQSFNGAAVTPQTAFAAYTAQAGELRLYGAPFVTSLASLSLGTEYVFQLQ